MKYLKSSNANSVSNVMDEIKDRKVMLAIYNLKEGHLDCASGPTHPMQMEMKYSLTPFLCSPLAWYPFPVGKEPLLCYSIPPLISAAKPAV